MVIQLNRLLLQHLKLFPEECLDSIDGVTENVRLGHHPCHLHHRRHHRLHYDIKQEALRFTTTTLQPDVCRRSLLEENPICHQSIIAFRGE
jgi:hypothetical protein